VTGEPTVAAPEDVLSFWRAAGPDKWFNRNAAFDAEVAVRFSATWQAAAEGRLTHWQDAPEHALALVIVLDQFPRNMFRGDKCSYATDPLARAVVERALARGFDRQVPALERRFFFLPFMHSENAADQARCLALAESYGDEEFSKHAELHLDIIRRFGRFPHRNPALGRCTTAEEQAFLDGGGFAG
jgi:uncharacterized protein (DUF924 family)